METNLKKGLKRKGWTEKEGSEKEEKNETESNENREENRIEEKENVKTKCQKLMNISSCPWSTIIRYDSITYVCLKTFKYIFRFKIQAL